VKGTAEVPSGKENTMKYITMTYASQQDYDAMSGKP
jgi:hypothetical protein